MKTKEWGEAILIVALLLVVYAIALYYIWRGYEEDIETTYSTVPAFRTSISSTHRSSKAIRIWRGFWLRKPF